MVVEKKKCKRVAFTCLSVGATFMFDGKLFLKTSSSTEKDNCFQLEEEFGHKMFSVTEVQPVEAKIVVLN